MFLFVHMRYRGRHGGVPAVQEMQKKPVDERIAGALAIAVASVTVLRTAGDLTSDHKGRSNALIKPAVNGDVRKKRVR